MAGVALIGEIVVKGHKLIEGGHGPSPLPSPLLGQFLSIPSPQSFPLLNFSVRPCLELINNGYIDVILIRSVFRESREGGVGGERQGLSTNME